MCWPYDKDKTFGNKVVLIIIQEVTIQETLETQKGENPFSVVMMIFFRNDRNDDVQNAFFNKF